MITAEIRKRKDNYEMEESHFEQNMLINNTEMYNAYIEKKKEEEEFGGQEIVWTAPETIEEARELERIFAEINQQSKQVVNKEADKEFVKQIGLMGIFGNLDIDQMGDGE